MDDLIFSHDFPAQKFVATLFERLFILETKHQVLLNLLIDVLAQRSDMTKDEMLTEMNDMLEKTHLERIESDPLFEDAWAGWTKAFKEKFGLK